VIAGAARLSAGSEWAKSQSAGWSAEAADLSATRGKRNVCAWWRSRSDTTLTAHKIGRYGRGRAKRNRAKRASVCGGFTLPVSRVLVVGSGREHTFRRSSDMFTCSDRNFAITSLVARGTEPALCVVNFESKSPKTSFFRRSARIGARRHGRLQTYRRRRETAWPHYLGARARKVAGRSKPAKIAYATIYPHDRELGRIASKQT